MSGESVLLLNGRVIDPATGRDEVADVLVKKGLVEGVERPGQISKESAFEVVDVKGCLVTPGLVDIHVHLREPGEEWKETIATGSLSAVHGGFTRICCMPNTRPAIDTAQVAQFVIERGVAAGLCRVHPIGAITKGRKGEKLAPFAELHEAGCVAYSDDGLPVMNPGLMRRALEYCRLFGGVLTCHEEDLNLSLGFSMNESPRSLRLGLQGFPGTAEEVMIGRDIELSRLTRGRVHFCHVTTRRGVQMIRRAKEDGIPVTGEATPHHFTADDSWVEGYNTQAKMSPPLRSPEDCAALMEGLADGTLDCIASDHAPHELDTKRCEFDRASFGIVGFPTTVPLTLAKVRSGSLTLMRAIEALTTSPSRCFNLPIPSLKPGAVADITVIDPERKFTLTEGMIKSKSKNTMFLGMEFQGLAVRTFLAGRQVYSAGAESGAKVKE